MRRVTTVIVWCLLALFSFSIVGCNTMRGAGEDIEGAGEGIQRAVD